LVDILNNRINYEQNNERTMDIKKVQQPKIPLLDNEIDNASFRLLMANLGFINPLNRNRISCIKHINSDVDINYADLFNEIDTTQERITIEVGILYMGKGLTLPEMLESKGSTEYNDFIDNIGWKIDLKTHLGYFGNLHPEMTGQYSRYYADINHEVMFHVASMFPNMKGNLHKTSLILNDPVLILWNEDLKVPDVSRLKATSGTIILITRLPSNVYHITNISTDNIIGPLLNNCVVTKAALSTLIIQTVIGAVTYTTGTLPLEKRNTAINKLLEKVGHEVSFGELYSNLFKLG